MKKVALLGANGRTAREIIHRIINKPDIQLTVFLRNANRIKSIIDEQTIVIDGNANNREDLKKTIRGQDIVISALGGMELDKQTQNIVDVMEELQVKRLVAISAGGIYDELPEPFNTWDKSMVGQTRPINLATTQVIETSNLDYTILRPVWLTNKETTEVQLTDKGETYKGTETSRASIAKFIVDIIDDFNRYKNRNLGITQPGTDGDKPAAFK